MPLQIIISTVPFLELRDQTENSLMKCQINVIFTVMFAENSKRKQERF